MGTVSAEVSRRGVQATLVVAAACTVLFSVVDTPVVLVLPLLVGLCVLPGYAGLVLGDRQSGRRAARSFTERVAESIVLSLATMLVLGGILALLGQRYSVAAPVVAILLVAAVRFVPANPRGLELSRAELSLTVGLITIGVSAVTLPAVLSVRSAVSFHGGLHLSIVQSVLQTGIPAANPDFAWRPMAFYWPYHLLVVTFSSITGAHPIVVTWTLNAVSLVVAGYFVVRTTNLLLEDRNRTIALPTLFAVGGLNAIAPFLFLLRRSGIPYALVTYGPVAELLKAILPAVPGRAANYEYLLSRVDPVFDTDGFLYGYTNMLWDGRLSSSFRNYLGNSSFGLGVALTAILLYLFLTTSSDRTVRRGGLFAMTTALVFHLHVLAGFFTITAFGLGSILHVIDAENRRLDRDALRYWFGVWTLAGALCLPLFIQYRSVGRQESQLRVGFWLSDLFGVVAMFLLVGPFVYLGIRRLWTVAGEEARVLVVIGSAFALIPVLVEVPGENNYKSFFLLAVPMAVVGTVGARQFLDRFDGRRRTVVVTAVVLLLLANPILFMSMGWPTQSEYTRDHQYGLEDNRLSLSGTAPYADQPFEHVSRTAPPSAAIIVDPIVFDRLLEGDGAASTLLGSALAGRNFYYGGRYPNYIPYEDAVQRNATRQAVLDCDPEAIHESTEQPVYVFVDTTRTGCPLHETLEAHAHWTEVASGGDLRVFSHPATAPQNNSRTR